MKRKELEFRRLGESLSNVALSQIFGKPKKLIHR